MSEKTKIAWTQGDDGTPGYTFNPWWGCSKVSEGCRNCYAETFARRLGKKCFGHVDYERIPASASYWQKPHDWLVKARKAGKRAKVFCASMCDVFEAQSDLDPARAKLADLIRSTASDLDWLLLTKRPGNFGLLPKDVLERCWLGVTVENQAAADERIPLLLQTTAAVRFLSCEPMIEEIDLEYPKSLYPDGPPMCCNGQECGCMGLPVDPPLVWEPGGAGVDWLIIGGESGPKARPFDLAWARSLLRQARRLKIKAFVKQMGALPVTGPLVTCDDCGPHVPIDEDRCCASCGADNVAMGRPENRLRFKDRAGADPAEWPEDLRVREFPEPRP